MVHPHPVHPHPTRALNLADPGLEEPATLATNYRQILAAIAILVDIVWVRHCVLDSVATAIDFAPSQRRAGHRRPGDPR